MNENLCEYDRKSVNFKSCLSIAVTVFVSTMAAVLVLFSCLVCSLAFNKKAENTAEIFGYKLFYCENNIEGTDIKEGSLVIVKNTDNDEFYSTDSLSENVVFVAENLGVQIKQNGFYMAVCLVIPFALIFIIVLICEIRKIRAHSAREPYDELEFKEILDEEFVLDD